MFPVSSRPCPLQRQIERRSQLSALHSTTDGVQSRRTKKSRINSFAGGGSADCWSQRVGRSLGGGWPVALGLILSIKGRRRARRRTWRAIESRRSLAGYSTELLQLLQPTSGRPCARPPCLLRQMRRTDEHCFSSPSLLPAVDRLTSYTNQSLKYRIDTVEHVAPQYSFLVCHLTVAQPPASSRFKITNRSFPDVHLICINDLSSLTVCLSLLICELVFTYLCIPSCNLSAYTFVMCKRKASYLLTYLLSMCVTQSLK